MAELLADSYALIAYTAGRPAYIQTFETSEICTTRMNLLELAYHLCRVQGVPASEVATWLAPMRPLVTEPPVHVVGEAAAFKLKMRRDGISVSYIDAWGYATARWLEIPFLTGDDDFEDVDHVAFVKA